MITRKISTTHLSIGLIIATLLPVIAWTQLVPLSERIATPFATLTSLSQVSALAGTVLFALLLLLRLTRFKKLLVAKVVGIISLILLLTHPLVAITKMAAFTESYVVSFTDWSISLGLYAFLVLISLSVITFLANRDNQKLRSLPFALNSVLFFGTFHAFFIPSSLSESIFIKTYILSLTGVVIVLYIAEFILKKKAVKKTTTLPVNQL